METLDPAIRALDEEAFRIVRMICSESVGADEIDRAVAGLARRTAEVFPERESLFGETYGRRFRRLRTWFRPRAGLFGA